MTTYAQPTYDVPIFNAAIFSSSASSKTPQKLQNFCKGIKVPFIEFTEDSSVQLQASEKTSVEYVTENIQLSTQPFNQNTHICHSEWLPRCLFTSGEADGWLHDRNV